MHIQATAIFEPESREENQFPWPLPLSSRLNCISLRHGFCFCKVDKGHGFTCDCGSNVDAFRELLDLILSAPGSTLASWQLPSIVYLHNVTWMSWSPVKPCFPSPSKETPLRNESLISYGLHWFCNARPTVTPADRSLLPRPRRPASPLHECIHLLA